MSYQYNGQMAPPPTPPPTVTGQMVNDVRPHSGASGTLEAVAVHGLLVLGGKFWEWARK
ncbi:hypothetical protein [Streptomyces sp. NRRL S-118]|uniref:hypothetical protein n=1 Tax=Streptomyces sp. NRRL S-118 TaxID=1463881 RepID=UPI000B004B4E|nr:hypothetical protein [Streptomyces sp. NRRL S-118]